MKGEDFAYPGLAPDVQDEEKTYHAYYQWVPFVLLLQGMLFYFPHWLWKTLEDRKLDKITNGLRGAREGCRVSEIAAALLGSYK